MKKLFLMLFVSLLSLPSVQVSANYDLDEIPVESLDSFYDDQVSTSDAAVQVSSEGENTQDLDAIIPQDLDLAPEAEEALEGEE